MERRDTVVIGAGPAGLAVAASLRRRGLAPLVLERGRLGESWRGRYDRLHLHTARRLSGLPGWAIPRDFGRWVARDDVVRYLDAYAARNGLDVETSHPVEQIDPADGGWELRSSAGDVVSRAVVVATGLDAVPFVPPWPGRDGFAGDLVHSSQYRNPAPDRGRDALVVGAGNSGAEIAVDLAEGGAGRVRLSVRTPPNIVRRDRLGVPSQVLGIVLADLPPRVVDPVARALRRLTIPDLSEYGLPRVERPMSQHLASGTVPILDVGLIDCVRGRRVEVVAAVERLDGPTVVLADGSQIEPDAVVAATGFRPGLETLVGALDVLGPDGRPRVQAPEEAAPGLWFVAFRPVLGGLIRKAGKDAGAVAESVVRHLARAPVESAA